MTKLYLRTYSLNKDEALKEVTQFLDDNLLEGKVVEVYGENNVSDVDEFIIKQLDSVIVDYEDEFNLVSLVKDLKALKTWAEVNLALHENQIVTPEEFSVLEHTLDLDMLKVIELDYEENCEIFIIEIEL